MAYSLRNFTTMNKFFLIFLSIGVFSVAAYHATPSYTSTSDTTHKHKKTGDIQWLTIEEALEKQKTDPRPWIIDVYTDWCGWCKRMDAGTFSDKIIGEEVNANYYAVKFDGEAKREIVWGDKTYKFVPNGRRGYHELAAGFMQGKMSYPTIVYLDENLNVLQPMPGYKSAQDLHPILKYLNGVYKTTSWEDFQKTYESPYKED